MRPSIVAGNWKMNGSLKDARRRARELAVAEATVEGVERILCPPHVHILAVAEVLGTADVALGAQDVSEFAPGAHTGETSAEMLVELGCTSVIVGHSERRAAGESSECVAAKFVAAYQGGLRPILCLGETLEQRDQGQALTVIAEQLNAVVRVSGPAAFAKALVAYEPVWAIGTGRNATPDQAQAVHEFIRGRMAEADATLAERLPLLYGGSVKADNAAELFAQPDVDGALVGGASLDVQAFMAICQAAAKSGG